MNEFFLHFKQRHFTYFLKCIFSELESAFKGVNKLWSFRHIFPFFWHLVNVAKQWQ